MDGGDCAHGTRPSALAGLMWLLLLLFLTSVAAGRDYCKGTENKDPEEWHTKQLKACLKSASVSFPSKADTKELAALVISNGLAPRSRKDQKAVATKKPEKTTKKVDKYDTTVRAGRGIDAETIARVTALQVVENLLTGVANLGQNKAAAPAEAPTCPITCPVIPEVPFTPLPEEVNGTCPGLFESLADIRQQAIPLMKDIGVLQHFFGVFLGLTAMFFSVLALIVKMCLSWLTGRRLAEQQPQDLPPGTSDSCPGLPNISTAGLQALPRPSNVSSEPLSPLTLPPRIRSSSSSLPMVWSRSTSLSSFPEITDVDCALAGTYGLPPEECANLRVAFQAYRHLDGGPVGTLAGHRIKDLLRDIELSVPEELEVSPSACYGFLDVLDMVAPRADWGPRRLRPRSSAPNAPIPVGSRVLVHLPPNDWVPARVVAGVPGEPYTVRLSEDFAEHTSTANRGPLTAPPPERIAP